MEIKLEIRLKDDNKQWGSEKEAKYEEDKKAADDEKGTKIAEEQRAERNCEKEEASSFSLIDSPPFRLFRSGLRGWHKSFVQARAANVTK